MTQLTREQQIAALEKTGRPTPLERCQARLLSCGRRSLAWQRPA